jgi:hypothetical protein
MCLRADFTVDRAAAWEQIIGWRIEGVRMKFKCSGTRTCILDSHSWIGEGFPGRAISELQTMAEKSYAPALKSLKELFEKEKDSSRRARLAQSLKQLTGKDFSQLLTST